jgi:thiosulfate dehydrogenase
MLAGAGPVLVAAAPVSVPLTIPGDSSLQQGPLGDAVRYGERIVNDTQAVVAAYAGNGLTCSNCHINGGRVAYAAPFAGLTGDFPEYRARTGRVESLEERINDCFLRSMNGRAVPPASAEMIGLLAYIAWLSQGVPTGAEVKGRGFQSIQSPSPPNASRGAALFGERCAACHGADGQGTHGAGRTYVFPPLWGPDSFNSGAGMARLSIAAAFVQAKMPLGAGGTLSDQQAFDLAAFLTAKPRPAFASGMSDWPKGDAPVDATTGSTAPKPSQ